MDVVDTTPGDLCYSESSVQYPPAPTPVIPIPTVYTVAHSFYGASALLAVHSTVIVKTFLPVCRVSLSHSGDLSGRMKI